MNTPWGQSQSSAKTKLRGIMQYGTPGHGGLHVSKKLNAMIPEYMRCSDGWYEEDIDWAIPTVVFPQCGLDYEAAKDSLKHEYPDAYEKFFGVTLQPGESTARDKQLYLKEHEDDWMVIAAWGDWYEKSRKGFCYVIARRGGREQRYGEPRLEERSYLVPNEEYGARHRFGFVIDESRHERVE